MSEINTWPGWECVCTLGAGAFGKVYEIRRTEFGKEFRAALKVITIPRDPSDLQDAYLDGMDHQQKTEYFRSLVEDIAAEFSLMYDLKGHSNIVSYEDHRIVEHEDGIGWDILIRMELLTPLQTYAQKHTMTEDDVIKLGCDICRGLELCKKKNIIHRDIKPQNIFINANGDYKLGDFGIARTAEKTMSNMTKTGTYTYMAPEVYLGRPYGQTADIYSLSMVLYQYLNDGRTPFLPQGILRPKDRETAQNRRMEGEAIPAPLYGSDGLKKTVLRGLSYNPGDRFLTPAAFREALIECYNRKRPAEENSDHDNTMTVRQMDAPTAEPGERPTPGQLKRLAVGVLCLAVIVAAGLAAFRLFWSKTAAPAGAEAQPAETEQDTGEESTGYSDYARQNIREIIDEAEGLEARGDYEGALVVIRTAIEVYPASQELIAKEALLVEKLERKAQIDDGAETEEASAAGAPVSAQDQLDETEEWPTAAAVRRQGRLNRNKLRQLVTNPKTVEKIQFLSTLEGVSPDAQDLSETGDGSVLGWIDDHVLCVAGRDGVTAPRDCSFLFSIEDAWEEERAYGHWDQLQEVDGTENFIMSDVTDMNGMFCYCRQLRSLDLNSWDTSHVTNMHRVFLHCDSISSLEIGRWDTSNVTDMKWMFDSCRCLTKLDIGNWDTSRVETMAYMFSRCPNLTVDISKWDLSSLTDDTNMFAVTLD